MKNKANWQTELNEDQLIEAIEKMRGFVRQVPAYIKKQYGLDVPIADLVTLCEQPKMRARIEHVRISLVEQVMLKFFQKALGGDTHAMLYILKNYKHHIDFLEPHQEDAPKKAPGEISEFMELLKGYNADPAAKYKAVSSISAEQRPN